MILRPYQTKLIADIRDCLRSNVSRVLAVLPTGGGKTVVASFLGRSVVERGRSFWFICHRDFLVTQTSRTFHSNGIEHGIVSAGHKPAYHKPVQICSIDTLRRRLDKLDPPDVVIWDEAHHIQAASWLKVMEWAAGSIHIGLSATPERLDGKGLGPPFERMVEGPTTGELIELGALSRYRAYAPSMPDLSGVQTVAGDFNQRQMAKAVQESVIMGDIVQTYLDKAQGLRAVYFAPSIEYSQQLASEFRQAGISALHLDGDNSTEERVKAAKRFASGEIDVLTNVALFGEGYDLAAQAGRDVTIDAVGLVRPTQSLALHRQQIGRCLRPKDYHAVILDHAGNIERHGLPDDPIEWGLTGAKKRKPSTRTCPHCFAIVQGGSRVCDACGKPFPVVPTGPRKGPEHDVDVEIEEIDLEEHRRRIAARRAEESRCQTYEDFVELGRRRGYKPAWAGIQWARAKQRVEAQARAYLRDYA